MKKYRIEIKYDKNNIEQLEQASIFLEKALTSNKKYLRNIILILILLNNIFLIGFVLLAIDIIRPAYVNQLLIMSSVFLSSIFLVLPQTASMRKDITEIYKHLRNIEELKKKMKDTF